MSTLLYYGFNSKDRRISGSGSFSYETQLSNYLHKHGIINYEIFKSRTIHKRRYYRNRILRIRSNNYVCSNNILSLNICSKF